MDKMKVFIRELYYAVRYREWVVYDISDAEVIYIGRRRDCFKVQEESYGGLVAIPLQVKRDHYK